MTTEMKNDPAETTERVEENIHNLPFTSVALAGLLGAGVMALLAWFYPWSTISKSRSPEL